MQKFKLKQLLAAGVVVALASLTACSGSGSGSDSMSGASEDEVAPKAAGGDSAGSADTGLARDAAGANRSVVKTKSVIRTGEVTITAKDLTKVRQEVDDLLAALGGTIDSERASNDRHGKVERSTLVLRVPVDRFAAAKSALMKLGMLKGSDELTKDVTTEVIDVNERVETLQNSLDDLQRFQRTAKDVDDLLAYEEKITARQSELQSLKAQQSYLADQTSMSTITVHLSVPDKYVPPPDALEDAGFLSGLKAGWHALGDFVVVGLTVLGAVLPFLVAGALVGVPMWLVLRLLLRRRHDVPPPAAPAES